MAALAYRDTTNENREFWRNEMGNALRDLQQVYDDKLESTRNDVETFYNLKVLQSRIELYVIKRRFGSSSNNRRLPISILVTLK